MPEQHLGRLRHDGTSKGVALVGTKIMTVSPATADQLLKVGAGVNVLVVRREIVQQFGRSMDTGWSEADVGLVMIAMAL
jgi:hypothetical protein